MISFNFFFRIKYLIKNGANTQILLKFLQDRLAHPFLIKKKKHHKINHKKTLNKKYFSRDYFSINAYYWKKILNINFKKKFSYLEIGSMEGNSTLFILKNFSTDKVICVDLWDHQNKFKKLAKKIFNNFLENLKDFKEKYSYFKMTSDKFFKNNKLLFDVIYIDGSHEAQQVMKDIFNSWKYLNFGGIIICDDYFYGNIYESLNENVPAIAINKFIKKKKKSLKVICVNNNQIFIKKIK